ncbi:YeeE/YedE family protein [Sphingomicrobium flavum]|uniref:YeeE/YedE family protein n=1 Tax=Sphingomicrobium flavum TaxID=1229164 RepID=UPI0021AE08F7|nr:YeeE/YedE thiosulfate transporter family protein [Sphingomicrobium flavum]
MLPGFPDAQPVEGLIGGVMIGLAAMIMLIGLGRIAGVSGLTARAVGLTEGGPSRAIAAIFLIAMAVGALLVAALIGPIEARFPPSAWVMIIAGLLVGYGTRLGSGCTSGHGVCGMSRLSKRSIVATLTFIASGMVTVAVMNALGGGW